MAEHGPSEKARFAVEEHPEGWYVRDRADDSYVTRHPIHWRPIAYDFAGKLNAVTESSSPDREGERRAAD